MKELEMQEAYGAIRKKFVFIKDAKLRIITAMFLTIMIWLVILLFMASADVPSGAYRVWNVIAIITFGVELLASAYLLLIVRNRARRELISIWLTVDERYKNGSAWLTELRNDIKEHAIAVIPVWMNQYLIKSGTTHS